MPTGVFEKMYNHILTDKGLELFDIDYAASIEPPVVTTEPDVDPLKLQ